MAVVKLQRGSEEFEMFHDYWKMIQDNWEVENTDSYWEKVIADSNMFYKKYNTAFSKDLSLVYINELERRAKGEQKLYGGYTGTHGRDSAE